MSPHEKVRRLVARDYDGDPLKKANDWPVVQAQREQSQVRRFVLEDVQQALNSGMSNAEKIAALWAILSPEDSADAQAIRASVAGYLDVLRRSSRRAGA